MYIVQNLHWGDFCDLPTNRFSFSTCTIEEIFYCCSFGVTLNHLSSRHNQALVGVATHFVSDVYLLEVEKKGQIVMARWLNQNQNCSSGEISPVCSGQNLTKVVQVRKTGDAAAQAQWFMLEAKAGPYSPIR